MFLLAVSIYLSLVSVTSHLHIVVGDRIGHLLSSRLSFRKPCGKLYLQLITKAKKLP
jgi:hypothetical protein